MSFKNEYATSY